MMREDEYTPYDDEDDEFGDEGEELDEFDQDALFFNELLAQEIIVELSDLDNRALVDFLSGELEDHGFSRKSDLILIGIDFDKQYILEFYNTREDKTVKSGTGMGSMRMMLDKWVLKTLAELVCDELYGCLGELEISDLTDCYLNILDDVIDWKRENGIGLVGSFSPEDDEPHEDK